MKISAFVTLIIVFACTIAYSADIAHTPLAPSPLVATDRVPLGRPSSGAADGHGTAYTASLDQIMQYVQAHYSGSGSGDMLRSVYDPTGINASPFSRANHTGAQPASTITGLAPVATSGSYNDLTNRPTIPADTSQLNNDAGFITASLAPVQSVNGQTGAVVVSVPSQPVTGNHIAFYSSDSTFAPILTVTGNPTIQWLFDDGTTSNSATPNKVYGTSANRINRVTVTPWSALVGINLGYLFSDGGPASAGGYTMNQLAHLNVSRVENLSLAASSLVFFCAENNPLTEINFDNFVALRDVEFYQAGLTSISLHNVPELRRVCLEGCALTRLDLTEVPHLEDLRGSGNPYNNITYAGAKPYLWHICTQTLNLANTHLYNDMTGFNAIREFWIWNANQTGTLRVPQSHPALNLIANGNNYTALDLAGSMLTAGAGGVVNLAGNDLTTVNITGCVGLTNLNLQNNALDSTAVDGILATLVSLGQSNGTVTLDGTNAGPTPTGAAHATTLAGRGWTVTVNATVGAVNITTTSLNTLTVGTAFSQALSASGGTSPYTWAVSAGSLPAGLSLNGSTGEISGTPTTAGAYSFTIQVTDNASATDTQAFSGTVNEEQAPANIELTASAQAVRLDATNATPITTPAINLVAGQVVAVSASVYSGSPTGVTDSLGNTYTAIANSEGSNGVTSRWFYSVIQNGGTATITMTNNGMYVSVHALQFAGINTSNPVDVAVGSSNGTTPAFTTAQANEVLLFAAHKDNAGAGAPYTYTPSGMTVDFSSGNDVDRIVAHRIFNSVQTNVTQGITPASGSIWCTSAITLRGQ